VVTLEGDNLVVFTLLAANAPPRRKKDISQESQSLSTPDIWPDKRGVL